MLKPQIKTFLFLAILTVILLGLGQLIAGRAGLYFGFAFALLLNFGTYWFSDKIVLAMYGAKPAPKQKYLSLHNDIESVCKTAGIPKPKVYIVPLKIANAFATGRNPKHAAVAVTEGILDKLNREELKGVLAHEISHVKNRDILIATIAATIAGVISYIAMMARYAAMFGGGDRDREGNALGLVGLLIAAIVAPIAALLIQLAISRTREYSADESGAMLLKNGLPLANALLKLEESAKTNPLRKGNTATSHLFIVNPFSAQGFVKLFMTHPPISERVARLRKLKF